MPALGMGASTAYCGQPDPDSQIFGSKQIMLIGGTPKSLLKQKSHLSVAFFMVWN